MNLTDIFQTTDKYVWTDGYPVTLTFWSESDPDNQSDNSCVALNGGQWNDTSCDDKKPFICETRPSKYQSDLQSDKTNNKWLVLVRAKIVASYMFYLYFEITQTH